MACRKTILSALGCGAVREALGGQESTIVYVFNGFIAMGVSRTLGLYTFVVMASFFRSAVS